MDSSSLEVLRSLLASLRMCWAMEQAFIPPKSTDPSHRAVLSVARSSLVTLLDDLHPVLREIESIGALLTAHIGHRLNALNPTHKLPVELLGDIFTEATSCDPVKTEQLSQTCVYWRKTALNHPALWSRIVLDDEETDNSLLALATVGRSAGLPLYIRIKHILNENMLENTLSLLSKSQGRLRELDLSYDPDAPSDATARLQHWISHSSLPSLKSLSLDMSFHDDPEHPPFGDNMPNLTSLYLVDSLVPRPSACKRLTKLEIIYRPDEWSAETFHILQVLRECQDLQTFHLESPFPIVKKNETETVLSLKCLHILYLDLPALDTTWLLSRICTSPSIELKCVYEDFGLWNHDLNPAPTVLLSANSHWQHLMDSIESINISVGDAFDAFDGISLEGIQGVSSAGYNTSPCRIFLVFKREDCWCDPGITIELLEDIAEMISSTYSFPKLISCNISFEGFVDPHLQDRRMVEHIVTLLRNSPVIDTIKFSYFPRPEHWGALVNACQSPSEPFLPLLRSLTVDHIGIFRVSTNGRPGLVDFLEAWEENSDAISPEVIVSAVHCQFGNGAFTDIELWVAMSSRVLFSAN